MTRLRLLILLPTFTTAHAQAPQCSAADARQALTGEFAPLGLKVATFSKTTTPGHDFFNYVNEGWIASTPIPDGYWDYGQTSILGSEVDRQIKSVLEEIPTTASPRGSARQQVGDAYASFRDVGAVERRGLTELRAELGRIRRSKTAPSIARWMANPTSSSIIAINVFRAERHWRVHLDQQNLNQPMLGLPNPDDYSRADAAALRESYRAYVAELFARVGVADAGRRAERLVALETRIASNMWPFEKLRDRKANYHPMTTPELLAYAPGFPWAAFLSARGVGGVTDIVLGTDSAVQQQARLFADTSIEDWQSYLMFHWIQNQIDLLPETLRQASWEFYGKTLSNAKAPPARSEVAARLVSSSLGHQLGRLYADRFVSERTKASATEMIAYLRRALAERLANAAWMDEATRVEALAKLSRFEFKVGYPGIRRDFSDLEISRNDAAGNVRRLRASDWAYQRRRLDPATKDEPWYQTPQTVDASYSVLMNAVELPGAFLQPPYFDARADPAVNFGSIGAIVGHEMGHAFDDQGVIYDSEGRLRNWWSAEALDEFHRRTQALVEQYSAYTPVPGVHVNGRRTIGENIADLSGVLLGLRAYHLYLADHPCEARAPLDGLTGDQRFFAAWAQAWRYKAPESAVRWVVERSYHAPTQYRVNGVLRNIDEWYAAFGVKPGDALYVPPESRVRIW